MRSRGFTLLEVLVAMAILAITLGTIIKTVGSYASNASYLKQKTLAQWVAKNKAAEFHINGQLPPTGHTEGEVEMAGQNWSWEVTITIPPGNKSSYNQKQRKLEINVYPGENDSDNPIASLISFVITV